MAKQASPYIVGEYWLDKRRDGASDAWQITWYDTTSRQVRYRSTRKESLDDAKPIIHAHADRQRSRQKQAPDEARIIPLLITYWEEHGRNTVSPAQIGSSLRALLGFLFQDEAGMNAVVTDINPAMIDRFRAWRMGTHSYDVPWGDKDYKHSSKGVSGETVQRNIEDFKAAINHAAKNNRLDTVPRIPSLASRYRSPARDRVLSLDEMGKIFWYAGHFPDLGRWITLMLATGARPEAATAFNPAQYKGGLLLDLQPKHWVRTKKHNPVVPAIKSLRCILTAWKREPFSPVKSRARSWRTMRAALGLPDDVIAKTIRHTIATWLYADTDVPQKQISDLLGHSGHMNRTTHVYAKYDPKHMAETRKALSRIWLRVSREARTFGAVHKLSIASRSSPTRVDKIGE
ncbi:phage integrase SAM-like domain-containing protein [Rhizorhapis sp. SPR117]|uniref:phage integrase SAM-like domain-containing protein n=1 Tax=Rhizorhapis sp. SPR117 TaxID=2912611 RepID=UPI001F20EEEA|nr:phage integrase SAM-like domain-containing protein [Rhizorhapis sp. SPR117]